MRRIICVAAALAAIAVITGTTAVPASADTRQRSFQIQNISTDPCPLQGAQCDSETVLVTIEVQAPQCAKPRNLQALVDDDQGLAEVVGTLPAKCRTWTPTRIMIRTWVPSGTAELLITNYSG